MRRLNELRANIYGMIGLIESEKVMEYINIIVSDIVKDACKEQKASKAAFYRSRAVAILGGIEEQDKLEYFYTFIRARLGLPEEVFVDVCEH